MINNVFGPKIFFQKNSEKVPKKRNTRLDGFRTEELALEWHERRHPFMTALVFNSFEVFFSKEGRRQDRSGRWVPFRGWVKVTSPFRNHGPNMTIAWGDKDGASRIFLHALVILYPSASICSVAVILLRASRPASRFLDLQRWERELLGFVPFVAGLDLVTSSSTCRGRFLMDVTNLGPCLRLVLLGARTICRPSLLLCDRFLAFSTGCKLRWPTHPWGLWSSKPRSGL